jgi:hypothetical protein
MLVVTSLNKLLEPNDTITGDFSGATFNISSLATNSINVVNVITRTDPLNAQADDEFGFAETIKEYPYTL